MLEEIIQLFFNNILSYETDIYNEFSLQHELGIFLRENLRDYKIQFERNISFFHPKLEDSFIKKEIDIVIYKTDFTEKYAIELKFPQNGQYPETMFSFVKDIKFMEQVKKQLGFTNTFVATLVTDKNFYDGGIPGEIYSFFRGSNTKILNGNICKPTGKKDELINIEGFYKITWKKNNSIFHYYTLKI